MHDFRRVFCYSTSTNYKETINNTLNEENNFLKRACISIFPQAMSHNQKVRIKLRVFILQAVENCPKEVFYLAVELRNYKKTKVNTFL